MLHLSYGALLGAYLVSCTACTVIYNNDVFSREDAGVVDARFADAAIIIEPTELSVGSVEPASLFEGMGASEFSRAVPIVVHGENIAPDVRIHIVGAGIDLELEAVTSRNGKMAAAELRIPVDPELPANTPAIVSVTLSQAGVEATTSFEVKGLDELTALPLDGDGAMNTSLLAPRYSQITITENVDLIGDTVARFVATDSITISGEIRANGRSDGERSAGGFLGGAAKQNGGGLSGGKSGGNQSGGGGGGNLEIGGAGQGDNSGPGGDKVTVDFLSPLSEVVGYGGGGGGGGSLLDGNGERGGAGGGGIELRAGGALTLEASARITANGANGVNGGCSGLSSAGAGGGGSGGALLLRSATEMIVVAGAAASANRGAGGTGNNCKGGDGSPGQIRADFPSMQGTLATTTIGPSFVPSSVPAITTEPQHTLTIAGGLGKTYFLAVNGAAPTSFTLADITHNQMITLKVGLNQVCALVAADGNQGLPESLTCVSIAYLPAP